MQLLVWPIKSFLIWFDLYVPFTFTSKENFPATRTRFYYPSPTVPDRKFSRWRNSSSDASFIGLICNLGAFGRNLPPVSCHRRSTPTIGRRWSVGWSKLNKNKLPDETGKFYCHPSALHRSWMPPCPYFLLLFLLSIAAIFGDSLGRRERAYNKDRKGNLWLGNHRSVFRKLLLTEAYGRRCYRIWGQNLWTKFLKICLEKICWKYYECSVENI